MAYLLGSMLLLTLFEIQENIGGNAALMAEKMVQLAPNNSQVAWLSGAILLSFIFSTWCIPHIDPVSSSHWSAS